MSTLQTFFGECDPLVFYTILEFSPLNLIILIERL